MHNASAERVSNAFFIIQSLRTNMSACGAEVLLLESVRPIKSSNFRTRVPNKRLKGDTRSGKAGFLHKNRASIDSCAWVVRRGLPVVAAVEPARLRSAAQQS
jgi:hypothetical protein